MITILKICCRPVVLNSFLIKTLTPKRYSDDRASISGCSPKAGAGLLPKTAVADRAVVAQPSEGVDAGQVDGHHQPGIVGRVTIFMDDHPVRYICQKRTPDFTSRDFNITAVSTATVKMRILNITPKDYRRMFDTEGYCSVFLF